MLFLSIAITFVSSSEELECSTETQVDNLIALDLVSTKQIDFGEKLDVTLNLKYMIKFVSNEFIDQVWMCWEYGKKE